MCWTMSSTRIGRWLSLLLQGTSDLNHDMTANGVTIFILTHYLPYLSGIRKATHVRLTFQIFGGKIWIVFSSRYRYRICGIMKLTVVQGCTGYWFGRNLIFQPFCLMDPDTHPPCWSGSKRFPIMRFRITAFSEKFCLFYKRGICLFRLFFYKFVIDLPEKYLSFLRDICIFLWVGCIFFRI